MAWHLLEKVIEHSASHSTIFGKWWIGIVFVFRIIIVASIGDTVYSDEQDEFVCNTLQPGCKQICYNTFAPISHIRFWALQIIATGTPPMLFLIFAMHRLANLPARSDGSPAKEASTQTSWRHSSSSARKSSSGCGSSNGRSRRVPKLSNDDVTRETTPPPKYEKICRENKVKRAKLAVLRAYVINVVFRTILEAACLFAQYWLYEWSVPEAYECIRYPCPKIVECFVSRPREKTIFLCFMFGVGCVCLVVNIVELKYLGYLRLKRLFQQMRRDRVAADSFILGTYPIGDVTKVHNRHHGEPQRFYGDRVIVRSAEPAPPGYYIPDVEPPSEKYHSPANGFPPIRLRAASFTTSESDVTSDDATSVGSVSFMLEENARGYL